MIAEPGYIRLFPQLWISVRCLYETHRLLLRALPKSIHKEYLGQIYETLLTETRVAKIKKETSLVANPKHCPLCPAYLSNYEQAKPYSPLTCTFRYISNQKYYGHSLGRHARKSILKLFKGQKGLGAKRRKKH